MYIVLRGSVLLWRRRVLPRQLMKTRSMIRQQSVDTLTRRAYALVSICGITLTVVGLVLLLNV